jgi:hypothetical protein
MKWTLPEKTCAYYREIVKTLPILTEISHYANDGRTVGSQTQLILPSPPLKSAGERGLKRPAYACFEKINHSKCWTTDGLFDGTKNAFDFTPNSYRNRSRFMTQLSPADDRPCGLVDFRLPAADRPISLLKFSNLLGITQPTGAAWIEKLPFACDDATAGSETELQAGVAGDRRHIDLVQAIENSTFYKNLLKRTVSGDAPRRGLTQLQAYLDAAEVTWENSWVRFPRHLLNAHAADVLHQDLRADKSRSDSPLRSDADEFERIENGTAFLRLPVSYMLKLALAQAVGQPNVPELVKETGRRMLTCFLNDNTSPETHSYAPVSRCAGKSLGGAVADETLLRYLLTQLLTQFANRAFRLEAHGQKALVYFCPHPPIRQKQLNGLISDSFYRQLFMSPCLSGWDRGEDKHRYMSQCHIVLSRSQLNTLSKLKEAGIIARNLVVLPSTSNICLANNGVHLSLGSRRLTDMLKNGEDFTATDEKYYGDLAIKICEHFLPLFVGTYSAAPYRFDFQDFHPEKVLGFLPHELDYTHLRMLWRRWKQKADIKFFGNPITPFGPEWIDRVFSRLTGMRGDWVHDFRLIDYLMAVLSTDESPALNGAIDNDLRLKADLAAMGIFDPCMPLYMLYRQRQFARMGFSGYEARHYSLFERFGGDMAPAIDLQHLVTLLAHKYILQRRLMHDDIPDSPTVESERRHIFFGSAIGIPTFYILKRNPNRLMRDILAEARHTRTSRRYPHYIRIPAIEYRSALLRLLRKDGADLIAMLELEEVVADLEDRIERPAEHAAAYRLCRRVLGPGKRTPLQLPAHEFNRSVEEFYRVPLKRDHLEEAWHLFEEEAGRLDSWQSWRSGTYNAALLTLLNGRSAVDYVRAAERAAIDENLPEDVCRKMIMLILLVYHQQAQAQKTALQEC